MNGDELLAVSDRLRAYAATQSGPFTSQEALSWFRRHAPSQAPRAAVIQWDADRGELWAARPALGPQKNENATPDAGRRWKCLRWSGAVFRHLAGCRARQVHVEA